MQPLSKYASPVLSLALLLVIASIAAGFFPFPLNTPGFQHFATVVTLFLWTAAPVAILYSVMLCVLAVGSRLGERGWRVWRRVKAWLFDGPEPAGRQHRSRYGNKALALCVSALLLPARQLDWLTLLATGAIALGVLTLRVRGSRPARRGVCASYADVLYRHAGIIAATAVVLAALEAMLPAAQLVEALRSLPVALVLAVGAGILLSASLPAALATAYWVAGLTGLFVAAVIPLTALTIARLWHSSPTAPGVEQATSPAAVHVPGMLTWSGYAIAVALLYASMPQSPVSTAVALFVLTGIVMAGVSEIRGLMGPEGAGVATRGALFTVLLPLAIGPGGIGLAGQPDLPVRLQVAQVGLRLNERDIQEFGFERMSEIPESDELLLDEHIFYDVVQILAREPALHAGRTMRFQGYVSEHTPAGLTVARDVVWCCLEHAERVGFLLRDPPDDIARGDWVEVVAQVAYEPGRDAPLAAGNDVFVPATVSELRRVDRPQFEYVLPF